MVALKNFAEQRRILTDFHDHPFTVTNAIRDAQTHIIRMHRGMKDAMLYHDNRQELDTIFKGVDESEREVYESLDLARERFLGDKTKMDRIKQMMDEWRVIRSKTVSLIRQGKVTEADAWHKTTAREIVTRIDTTVGEILKFSTGKAESFVQEADGKYRETYLFTLILIVAAIVMALVVAVVITNSIVGPLAESVAAADLLAAGDLSAKIGSDALDEPGQLQRSMGRMIDTFRRMGENADRIARGDLDLEVVPNSERDVFGVAMKGMVESLKRTADTADRIAGGDLTVEVRPASDRDRVGNSLSTMARCLRAVNTEIHDVVNVLATSTSEIMSTVSEFASSATETASAISETNATVQEVRQTTDMTSQKSKHVYDTAQRGVGVARNGRRSVEDAIGGMEGIQERMAFIAERIVKLSEQSQAIGEIIATVNDLAEQSNLLAVNAAIEAAKAGDQGKGFAVVAQEVRSLATQSKQATAQIRGILGDIQKATTAAVLATEQGSKAVEAGMKQSREAGDAIRLLAASTEETSNSTLQIVTSTQEQAIGMDQIATAIQSISQASSQNMEGSRQIESATRSLNDLNRKLKELVSHYKV